MVKILKLKFRRDFEAEFAQYFAADVWNWNLGQDSEVRFSQVFKFKLSRDTDVFASDFEVNA